MLSKNDSLTDENINESASESDYRTYSNTENKTPIGLKYSRLYLPMIIIAIIFIALIFSHIFVHELHHFQVNLLLSLIGLTSLGKIILVVKSEFYVPFIHIRNWSLRVKANDYSARLPTTSEATEFNKLAIDLNILTEILQFFSDEFRDKVKQQTSIIKDQDDSLRILYKTATTINNSHHIEETYLDFLKILTQLTSAHAGAIRLVSQDMKHIDQLQMVASIGLSDEFVKKEEFVSINRCLCGESFTQGEVRQLDQVTGCEQLAGAPLFEQQGANILVVPIDYQGKYLGVYNLYLSDKNINIKNCKLILNIAFNYSSRLEIIRTFKKILKKNKHPSIKIISQNLYTKLSGDPEILIRTGGRNRLSDFYLWQVAYSEIFFVNKLWPDFKTSDLEIILKKFKNIKRNFGG